MFWVNVGRYDSRADEDNNREVIKTVNVSNCLELGFWEMANSALEVTSTFIVPAYKCYAIFGEDIYG